MPSASSETTSSMKKYKVELHPSLLKCFPHPSCSQSCGSGTVFSSWWESSDFSPESSSSPQPTSGQSQWFLKANEMEDSDCRVFLFKYQMAQYINNNKHIKNIEKYVKNCRYLSCVSNLSNLDFFLFYNFSIGDWFVLYQMNKNMNKRFFAEFVALLSMKVKWRDMRYQKLYCI